MHDTKPLSVSENAQKLFNFLLMFYPQTYRRKFENEMRFLFNDLYREEIKRNGRIKIGFCLTQSIDLIINGFLQHLDLIRKYLSTELNLNIYNMFGFIFLLPAMLMFLTDLLSRISQGDLTHYNRSVYYFLSHTPLYWYPVLVTWTILLPGLALLINLVPFIKSKIKHKNMTFTKLISLNWFSALLSVISLGFITIVKLHDFAPCMIHGIFLKGFNNLGLVIKVCKNV